MRQRLVDSIDDAIDWSTHFEDLHVTGPRVGICNMGYNLVGVRQNRVFGEVFGLFECFLLFRDPLFGSRC